MCFAPQWRALFRHLNLQKWSGAVCFVHFDFEMCFAVCFVHFDFEMCFAPQRRALFRRLNFQKWSGPAALVSLLFNPPEPEIMEKYRVSRLSYLFGYLGLLSSEISSFWFSFFSSLLLWFLPPLLIKLSEILTTKYPSNIGIILLFFV